ncbi:hypothetical protein HS7_11440 [Sulfolobales archaeon HS-7]|nr:hypothetical protein HS7_11440 [Sulfolobales archaeon HS-7]
METLDLREADAKCGADSPSARLMKKWVEVGGGVLSIIAVEGVQSDAVDMWIEAFKPSGLKLISKDKGEGVVKYVVELPERI